MDRAHSFQDLWGFIDIDVDEESPSSEIADPVCLIEEALRSPPAAGSRTKPVRERGSERLWRVAESGAPAAGAPAGGAAHILLEMHLLNPPISQKLFTGCGALGSPRATGVAVAAAVGGVRVWQDAAGVEHAEFKIVIAQVDGGAAPARAGGERASAWRRVSAFRELVGRALGSRAALAAASEVSGALAVLEHRGRRAAARGGRCRRYALPALLETHRLLEHLVHALLLDATLAEPLLGFVLDGGERAADADAVASVSRAPVEPPCFKPPTMRDAVFREPKSFFEPEPWPTRGAHSPKGSRSEDRLFRTLSGNENGGHFPQGPASAPTLPVMDRFVQVVG